MSTNRQRVFDALATERDAWLSKEQIIERTRLTHDAVVDALSELGHYDLERKPAPPNGQRGQRWLYRLLPEAERPTDRRKGKVQATA